MPPFAETVLRTKRCVLRPWQMRDAPSIPPIANTRAITRNTTNKFPYPYDEAAALKFLRFHTVHGSDDMWPFAILKDGTIIGGCSGERGGDVFAHTATIGYWLDVAQWGQGLATECLAELIRFLAQNTDIERLSADCFGWNPASGRVLEKNGFERKGVRKGAVRKWGEVTDLLIYGRPLP